MRLSKIYVLKHIDGRYYENRNYCTFKHRKYIFGCGKIKDKLVKSGHSVGLKKIEPVRAFSMSPVLLAYLAKIDSLKDQKIDLFVTQFFPYPWMGGKNAISQMKKTCETKGATVGLTGIINWKNRKREKMIQDLLDQFSRR